MTFLAANAQTSTNDQAMADALEVEVLQFEVTVASVAMMCSGGTTVIALMVAVGIDASLGWPLVALSAGFWAWFGIVRWRTSKGRLSNRFRVLQHIVEGATPLAALLVMAFSEDAAYALGSWVVPMLIMMVISLSAIRLRPAFPVALGAASAAVYLFLFYVVIPRETLPSSELYSPQMQWIRALTILMTGLVAGHLCNRMGATFTRAAGRIRADELFGKYRIGDVIAAGGMGVVHHATYCPDGGFERPVAIKRIHPHLLSERRIVDSFREEAELGARLHHPHIVATFDFGRADDTYFLAMEFVDGEDLARLLSRVRAAEQHLSEAAVLHLATAIASALAYAHGDVRDQSGTPIRVIHRDLSPANLLISRRGTVKLSDFGVARALREGERHHSDHLAGKLSYMAPEQARGGEIDERSDLYAAGLLLFEALTLRPAQGRSTDAETLAVMLDGTPPSATEVRPEILPQWDALLKGLLARDPGERVASAAVLSIELQKIAAMLEAKGVTLSAATTEIEHILRDLPLPEFTLDGEGTQTQPLRKRVSTAG